MINFTPLKTAPQAPQGVSPHENPYGFISQQNQQTQDTKSKVGAFPTESFSDWLNKPAYDMSQNTSGLLGTVGKETANIVKSGAKFGKGVVDFLNPIETAKKLGKLPGEIGGAAQDQVSADQSQAQAHQLEAKAQQSDAAHGKTLMAPVAGDVSAPNPFAETGKAAIKSVVPEAVQKAATGHGTEALASLANDPFQLAPAFLMLKGALETKTGGTTIDESSGAPRPETYGDTKVGSAIDNTISKTAEPVIKAGQAIGKPVAALGKLGANLAKFATSQATGLSPKTMETIVKNPDAFSKENLSQYSREGIAKQVKTSIDQRLEDLSSTGKEYQSIRTSGESVSVPKGTISTVLDKFGIKVGKNGVLKTSEESVPMSSADRSALQDFVKTYGTKSELTSNAFLNARKFLSNMSSYDSAKTDASTSLARNLRGAYDALGKDQLTGLDKLDAKYSPEVKLLKQIKTDYLKPDGSFKDNALTKIANLTNEGRQQILGRLEQIEPGIGKKIAILKAVEDINAASGQKVGTYARGIVAGGGVLSGNVPAIVGAILSEPRLATQILRGYGKLQGVDIGGTLEKVFNSEVKPRVGLTTEDTSLQDFKNQFDSLKVKPGKKIYLPKYKESDITPPNNQPNPLGESKMVTPNTAPTPESGSAEQIIERNEGWKTGDRAKFDNALMHGDAATVQSLLPSVPAAYVSKFAKNIVALLGKGAGK